MERARDRVEALMRRRQATNHLWFGGYVEACELALLLADELDALALELEILRDRMPKRRNAA